MIESSDSWAPIDTGRSYHAHLRFNIASVLGVILFFGIGIAALRESGDLWDSGLFTLTLGMLLVSIRLVLRRSEGKHAFWIGSALLGWG
jgi:hypothetical protein